MPPRNMPMTPEKMDTGVLKKLFTYNRRYLPALIIAVVFALGGAVCTLIGPEKISDLMNTIFQGILTGVNMQNFEAMCWNLVFLYALSAFLSYGQQFITSTVTQYSSRRLRSDIDRKISRLPLRFFDQSTKGDILSRITNDVDTLGTGLNQSITQIITSVATIIGVIVMMLTISPLMTLIALVVIPVSAVLMTLLIRFSQKYFKTQQNYLGHINGQVEENFAGQQVIKAFSKEDDVIETFGQTNDVLYDSAWKSQCLSGIMQPLMMFVGNLGYAGVAISGGFLAIRGTIGIGDIQAFIQYVKNLTQPIAQIAQVMNQVQSMTAASERVFEFLAEEEEELTPPDPVHLEKVEGRVRFDHVRFGYSEDQIVINDFSAVAEPGQKIAIVGPTGAGKTTMVKLLMRFYDVDAGAILVDGRDVRDYARGDLRRAFGMVLQDTWLFKGTIMENIRYGRPDATDAEVIAAAKAARADAFIRTLPGGYQMELNEEATNVSQGQKQLLTIARAVLANAPILILDEATSSVDTRTEQLIQEAMDHLMRGRTSFVIAHRLSTIRNADCILVMRDGNIVEQGTHAELLARGGFYAALYNSQFEDVVA